MLFIFRYEWSYGEGIIGGLVFVLTGILGFITSAKLGRSLIALSLLLLFSILSVILSIIMVFLSCLNIIFTPHDLSYFYHGGRLIP